MRFFSSIRLLLNNLNTYNVKNVCHVIVSVLECRPFYNFTFSSEREGEVIKNIHVIHLYSLSEGLTDAREAVL